ncbi:MAG: hypothetical protein IKM85_10405 [Bacteroidales bacterium]|nr:hypothetical protein [Bacteroidales bacterium]
MKTKWLVLALLLMAQLTANASCQQEGKGLFENKEITRGHPGNTEPGGGGGESLPLGSGLLVLTGLAAGYALVKGKRNKEE